MPISSRANCENRDGDNFWLEAPESIAKRASQSVRDLIFNVLSKIDDPKNKFGLRNFSLSNVYLTLDRRAYLHNFSDFSSGRPSLSKLIPFTALDTHRSRDEVAIVIIWRGHRFCTEPQSLQRSKRNEDSEVTVVLLNLLGNGKHHVFSVPVRSKFHSPVKWVEGYRQFKTASCELDSFESGKSMRLEFDWITQSCEDACSAFMECPRIEIPPSFDLNQLEGTVIAEIDGLHDFDPEIETPGSKKALLGLRDNENQSQVDSEASDAEQAGFSLLERTIIGKLRTVGLPCEIYHHDCESEAKRFEVKYERSYLLCLRSTSDGSSCTCVVAGAETVEESEKICSKALEALTNEEYARLSFFGFTGCFDESDVITL